LPVFENDSNDIRIVYDALKLIDQKKNSVHEACVIDVEDCGAAYRFLMALLVVTQGKWILTGTPRLLERPILPLVNFLNAHGAKIQQTEKGWHIEGSNVHIENIDSIGTEETSQFLSAIMMLPQGERRKTKEKNPYLRMTETVLYTEKLVDSPLLKLSDWSAAVFWLANALLTPNAHYLLKDLHFDKLQGDADIVPYFKQWGLAFAENKSGIKVQYANPVKILKQTIDVTHTPDIAMILATLAVCYPFELTLSGLKNLNLKESNRLDIMIHELSKFTTVIQNSETQITIQKRSQKLPESFYFDSYNDHRFVMAWSLFKNFGNVKIENPVCIKKSYPEFPKFNP
jgi:3-phosphoshikimate 1-carboxyvinyltransferase